MKTFAVYNGKTKTYKTNPAITQPVPKFMLPYGVVESGNSLTTNSNEPELVLPYGVVESAKAITSNSNEPELLLPFGVHE